MESITHILYFINNKFDKIAVIVCSPFGLALQNQINKNFKPEELWFLTKSLEE